MQKAPLVVAAFIYQVYPRIMRCLVRIAASDLKQHRRCITAILQTMAIRNPGLETGTVTGAQHRLATFLAQHHLA